MDVVALYQVKFQSYIHHSLSWQQMEAPFSFCFLAYYPTSVRCKKDYCTLTDLTKADEQMFTARKNKIAIRIESYLSWL